MRPPEQVQSVEQQARDIEPMLKQAGWALSLGAIAAVIEALDTMYGPPAHEPCEQLCGCGEFCNQSIGSPFKGKCRRTAHGLPVKSGVCVCGDSSLPGTHRTDGPCHQ